MKTEDFLEELRKSCRVHGLPAPFEDEKRPGTIRTRIKISSSLHATFYFNEETGTMTTALLLRNKRVFGYDAYPAYNSYHVHPLHEVQKHSPSRELSIEQLVKLYPETVSRISSGR